MALWSGLPEFSFDLSRQRRSSDLEREIFSIILENWPTSALEIAEHFKEDLSSREKRKKASTKYTYYLQKLVKKQKIFGKRIGNALVVWPMQAEKLRTIHSILESEV